MRSVPPPQVAVLAMAAILPDLAGWLRYPFNLFAAKDLHVNSCGAEPCHVVPL